MNKVGFHFKKISNFELLLPIEILAKKNLTWFTLGLHDLEFSIFIVANGLIGIM